jgi:hypothetical protein
MHPEHEALQRCTRLLDLMTEALRREQASVHGAGGADARLQTQLRPLLEQALHRLETLLAPASDSALQAWLQELTALEHDLDALLNGRGGRWPPAACAH